MATAGEVRAANDQLTAAAKVLADVRNVHVRVTVEWQQIGDLAAEVAADLEAVMARTARAYVDGRAVLSNVRTSAKSHCVPAGDLDALAMALPVLWREPINDPAKVRAALLAAAPAHDWAMPHDARHDDWRSCPPNCPHLAYITAHGLHEARPAEPGRVP